MTEHADERMWPGRWPECWASWWRDSPSRSRRRDVRAGRRIARGCGDDSEVRADLAARLAQPARSGGATGSAELEHGVVPRRGRRDVDRAAVPGGDVAHERQPDPEAASSAVRPRPSGRRGRTGRRCGAARCPGCRGPRRRRRSPRRAGRRHAHADGRVVRASARPRCRAGPSRSAAGSSRARGSPAPSRPRSVSAISMPARAGRARPSRRRRSGSAGSTGTGADELLFSSAIGGEQQVVDDLDQGPGVARGARSTVAGEGSSLVEAALQDLQSRVEHRERRAQLVARILRRTSAGCAARDPSGRTARRVITRLSTPAIGDGQHPDDDERDQRLGRVDVDLVLAGQRLLAAAPTGAAGRGRRRTRPRSRR